MLLDKELRPETTSSVDSVKLSIVATNNVEQLVRRWELGMVDELATSVSKKSSEDIGMAMKPCRSLRVIGSTSLNLAWIAIGRLDAMIQFNIDEVSLILLALQKGAQYYLWRDSDVYLILYFDSHICVFIFVKCSILFFKYYFRTCIIWYSYGWC